MNQNARTSYLVLVPLLLTYFAMGFVDLVGIASNYLKVDLNLTDAEANLFPSLVFFWFLICAVPTGMLMNRIGRRRTVVLSLAVTTVSLLIPLFSDAYIVMLVSFSLLGIGNALMQTSTNPLLTSIVSGDKLASSLTFGQFVKAIASFLAPYIAMWGSTHAIPDLGLGWRVLFPIYMVFAFLAMMGLSAAPIVEKPIEGKPSTFKECFSLLGNPFILLCFVGIMCHVGLDVGTNTTAPKILMERLGMDLTEAGFATSLYFIFRTAGCFTGSFILQKIQSRTFFAFSAMLMILALLGLIVFDSKMMIYACIAMMGYGNSNIFPIILSQALLAMPNKQNEVSGLMIMGILGGTIFPIVMGVASDMLASQTGAIIVLLVGAAYLMGFMPKLKKS